ncbi:MAG: DUF5034 domain-containing protein [Flavobacteriales bacterium]|nr:DUF5034 domain-containing protein [Flavobacteriales bacterium]
MSRSQLFYSAILIFIFMGGMSSCCDETEFYCNDIVQIEAVAMRSQGNDLFTSSGDTLEASTFTLGLVLEMESANCSASLMPSFSNQAYAATRCPFELRINQDIRELEIISMFDFDEDHPAGASLKEYFVFDDLRFDDEIKPRINYFDTIPWFMIKEPTQPSQQFIITLDLGADSTIVDTTQIFYLQ